MSFTVPLSHLIPNKRNPRRVKPDRDAHRRLVALIKAHGLMHPLIVRPVEGKRNYFMVVTGDRRLAALREIHQNDGDPKIPCVLRKVNAETADALSLGENVGREPLHPLDEAEAFAKLTRQDGKDAAMAGNELRVGKRNQTRALIDTPRTEQHRQLAERERSEWAARTKLHDETANDERVEIR